MILFLGSPNLNCYQNPPPEGLIAEIRNKSFVNESLSILVREPLPYLAARLVLG